MKNANFVLFIFYLLLFVPFSIMARISVSACTPINVFVLLVGT